MRPPTTPLMAGRRTTDSTGKPSVASLDTTYPHSRAVDVVAEPTEWYAQLPDLL